MYIRCSGIFSVAMTNSISSTDEGFCFILPQQEVNAKEVFDLELPFPLAAESLVPGLEKGYKITQT